MKVILPILIISLIINAVLGICLNRKTIINKIHNPCGCKDCIDVYIQELNDIFPQLKKVETKVVA